MIKSLLITVVLMFAGTVFADDTTQQRIADSRAVAKQFGATLKTELITAMQAGGPIAAIDVCNKTAPAIAHSISTEKGWQVGRTSLKVRNPGNTADDWERAVLRRFEASKAQGTDPNTLEYSETVQTAKGAEFRYMKAIPMGQPCLACHGATLAPEISKKLGALYPEDQATGFKAGDIRGAFTITQPQ